MNSIPISVTSGKVFLLASLRAATFRVMGFILCVAVWGLRPGEGFGAEEAKIRVAHFATVTHAPALVARAKGHFEQEFQGTAQIDWKIFNAGPLAIEALFADEVDILYAGPNPAVNGYVRSKGEALRVLAGVASGGSAFVVRSGSGIERFEDIRAHRVASPQIGNSQDVVLRFLMHQKGLKPRHQGGDVELFHVGGGDQLIAMARGEVDAAWTVEPFVSRLVSEAGGRILLDEGQLWPGGQYATALLVVRRKFVQTHPAWVEQWVRGHVTIIDWMNEHLEEAKRLVNEELRRETGASLSTAYLDQCFNRITFTYEPMEFSVLQSAKRAETLGLLGREKVTLDQLYDLSFLNRVRNQVRAERAGHAHFD